MRAVARRAVLLAVAGSLVAAGPARALAPHKNRFVATRSAGTVKVTAPGSHHAVRLRGATVVKGGSTVDTRKGTVTLVAKLGGARRTARVSKGLFVAKQIGATVRLTLAKGGISCHKPYGHKRALRRLRVRASSGWVSRGCFIGARRAAGGGKAAADWTTTDRPGTTTVRAAKGPVGLRRAAGGPAVTLSSKQSGTLAAGGGALPALSGDGTADDPNGDLRPCSFAALPGGRPRPRRGQHHQRPRALLDPRLLALRDRAKVVRGVWPVLEISRYADGFANTNDRTWDVDPRNGGTVAVIDRFSPFSPTGCPGTYGCQTGTGSISHPAANEIAYTIPLSAIGGVRAFRWIAAEFQCDYDDRVPDRGSISLGIPPRRPAPRLPFASAAC